MTAQLSYGLGLGLAGGVLTGGVEEPVAVAVESALTVLVRLIVPFTVRLGLGTLVGVPTLEALVALGVPTGDVAEAVLASGALAVLVAPGVTVAGLAVPDALVGVDVPALSVLVALVVLGVPPGGVAGAVLTRGTLTVLVTLVVPVTGMVVPGALVGAPAPGVPGRMGGSAGAVGSTIGG